MEGCRCCVARMGRKAYIAHFYHAAALLRELLEQGVRVQIERLPLGHLLDVELLLPREPSLRLGVETRRMGDFGAASWQQPSL